MKIAISSIGQDIDGEIDERFGRCKYFLIIETKDHEIMNTETIENKGANTQSSAGVSAAKDVVEAGAEAVISGNFGPRAVEVFKQFRIKMYQAKGKISEAIKELLDNRLEEFDLK